MTRVITEPYYIASKDAKPTVYFFYNTQGDIIYIGKTSNPYTRMRVHAGSSKWFSQAADLDFHFMASEPEAMFYEAQMIIRHKPPNNDRIPHGDESLVEIQPVETVNVRWVRTNVNSAFMKQIIEIGYKETEQEKIDHIIFCGKMAEYMPPYKPDTEFLPAYH